MACGWIISKNYSNAERRFERWDELLLFASFVSSLTNKQYVRITAERASESIISFSFLFLASLSKFRCTLSLWSKSTKLWLTSEWEGINYFIPIIWRFILAFFSSNVNSLSNILVKFSFYSRTRSTISFRNLW